ncbi:uncharacterized protein LOC127836843 [Dreissena polymorpha]|uniref:Secreted protein n=1 Tax=Dreissena polymorpha TaxID=45954 RepID=A0A9D4F5P2_DREPO|nr:uncharacterized protein LOC127836843 [Dreissena polymorpha]KAH3791791.1 hypothetical protein DPMN_145281 [Dreissena polymorpha]
MNARVNLIAIVFVATLLVTEAKLEKEGLSGEFKWNNTQCTWKEGFDNLNRILIIHCKQKGKFCKYRGNPHVKSCAWYNKNQAKFYKCLVDELIKDTQNLCNPNKVVCYECPKVEFGRIEPLPQRRRPVSENRDYTHDQDSQGSVDDYFIDNY